MKVYRTVEFHEYGEGKRQVCGTHCDHGSLFTADVMLSRTSDFTGGLFQTTATRQGEAPVDTAHQFERGDMLVFPSHKPHAVEALRSGTRNIMVCEVWEGLPRRCKQRCDQPWLPCYCKYLPCTSLVLCTLSKYFCIRVSRR